MNILDKINQFIDDVHTLAGGPNTPPTPGSPVPGSSTGSNI